MLMKFKNILILICSVYFFSGCDDYLDLVPEDDILTIPKIFETRSGAGQWMIDANLLFNMLAIHQTGNPALMGADEYTAGTYARVDKVLTSFYIADGLQTALSPLGDIWDYKSAYYYIRLCNTFLEHIGDVYNLRAGELET